MKKNLFILLLIVLNIFIVFCKNNTSIKLNEETKSKKINMLSFMLETEAGSGNYQKTMANEWPTDGYTFNEFLSKCENGGTLSWDNTSKKVVMEGNSSDKCYVY